MFHFIKQFWTRLLILTKKRDHIRGTNTDIPGGNTAGAQNFESDLCDEIHRRQAALPPELKIQKWRNGTVDQLYTSASQGNPEAVFELSRFYLDSKNSDDPIFAHRLLRFAAEREFPRAYPTLGKTYIHGIGTARDPEAALHWIQRIAEPSDDPDILAFLGWCYHTGTGGPRDTQKSFDYFVAAADSDHPDALRLLHTAAESGHARGQYILGAFYQHGQGIPADMPTALRWFHKSAEQGYADAQCRLGIIYSDDEDNVEPDHAVAVQWFRLAAAQGDIVAKNHLAQRLIGGLGMEKDLDAAAELLREAAAPTPKHPQGDAVSQYALARLYLTKDFSGYSPKKGIKWLRKAARQDLTVAQAQLGICRYEGFIEVPPNMNEARYWLRKAAKKGNVPAQFLIGEIYADGNGVPANPEKAAKWYRKAARAGYVSAQQKYAHCLLHGIGTPKKEYEGYSMLASLAQWGDEEALTLLQTAAASGNAAAEYGMFWYTFEMGKQRETEPTPLDNAIEKARHWLESAAEKGLAKAQCSLATIYAGEGDTERQLHYLRCAAEQGESEAQFRLALALVEAPNENASSKEDAFRWMKAAARHGSADANYYLGNFYRYGTGTKPDNEKAFGCYLKSAQKGDANGMERLAVCFLTGEGTEPDSERACQLFRYAAEQGNPNGQCGFGLCYLNGTGCPQNIEAAFRWISLAAKSGHPAVIQQLEHAGLDIGNLSNGYQAFHEHVSAMQGDKFGQNFERIFSNGKQPIKPTPPSNELTQQSPSVPR